MLFHKESKKSLDHMFWVYPNGLPLVQTKSMFKKWYYVSNINTIANHFRWTWYYKKSWIRWDKQVVTWNSCYLVYEIWRKPQKQTNKQKPRNLKTISSKIERMILHYDQNFLKIGNKLNYINSTNDVCKNIPKIGGEGKLGRGSFTFTFFGLFTFWSIYLAYASVFLFCFLFFFFVSFAILFLFRSLVPFPRLYLCLIFQSFFAN